MLEWSENESLIESHDLELKLKSLLLDTIHHIEIVKKLIVQRVSSVDDWTWQKQLRFGLIRSLITNIGIVHHCAVN